MSIPTRCLVPALALAALAALPACRCTDGPIAVDRSDGQLPELRVTKVARGSITIDGHLREEAWKTAVSTGPLVDPGNGKPRPGSPVAASGKLLWDGEKLYLAITVNDRNPSSPYARDAVDPHIWAHASGIEVMLQPGDPGDNRNYFEVQVDVAGAVWDTRFDDYNRPIRGSGASRRYGHQAWSAHLERAVVIDRGAGRYTIEAALPLATLKTPRTASPPVVGATWRANLYTFRDGQRHALAWSPLLRQGNFHKASRFGRLVFAGSPGSPRH
ncbi:MAG: carbohydrate-binding family 9-like protein [Deltaproteobacteria bacterium]|nr:carbohydrate-binding family 9-like protein [Deltaproteobacteria bacterium]